VSDPDPTDTGSVVGVGVDLVSVPRVARALQRRPGLAQRLLTERESARLDAISSEMSRQRSLAVRLAGKEAVMKSLGVGMGAVGFKDIEIAGGRGSQPRVSLSGRAARRAALLSVDKVALSLSHDGDMAMATAVATRRCTCGPS